MQGYDIIGDIHGCASALHTLLTELGYQRKDGTFTNPERQAIFVGDLVDRGSEQLRVLEIVKDMVDGGHAQIVMGNHEFNAIGYATEHPAGSGRHLREHSDKNNRQHRQFVDQLTDDQRAHYVQWFTTLPLWLDLGDLRVVHACWHEHSMRTVERQLGSNCFSSLDQIVDASTKGSDLYQAIEVLLKGPEISLTARQIPPFKDKDDHLRGEARIRWWDNSATTLRQIAEISDTFTAADGTPYPPLPDVEITPEERSYTYSERIPVLYGHYWRTGSPRHTRDWTAHCACVDFSAAKGGKLTAYRWSGESTIQAENYWQSG
ncbi:MAG: metallophosphatase [Mycobacterium sp.]|uniref:Metallophosphatase n=1 Tax=Mycobacterium gordonae TaxID=1778 RepID=A0A1A6BF42_MYCGO|nr:MULTISPECIES: metallophosphoesterase [Mycobacterium]MBI2700884.1 metallophosphoesterase [Mycobacterium sp.]MBX9981594.1 metallophosphoesterase [Mycobacterium gordonae]MCQ4364306.1 metallophosphoesterase [Mycobacterium gordonae]OBS00938.1 metallophosphatase [Mycobacterium gordonae]PJE04350.1 MAG: metallophosphatase [Mycobacterium sp.]